MTHKQLFRGHNLKHVGVAHILATGFIMTRLGFISYIQSILYSYWTPIFQTYSPRLVESSNSVVGTGGPVFFGNAATYTTYGSTVPVLAPTEYPTFPQTPAAPTTPSAYPTIMYPQPVYYPQQYQYQPTVSISLS